MAMNRNNGIHVRNERIATLDWSDAGYTDEDLLERIETYLPDLLGSLNLDAGNAECSLNLANNKLKGPEPLSMLLSKLREAKIQVVSVRLHKNQLSDAAIKPVVEHIKAAAQDRRPLWELHLSDNKLTEAGVRKLVVAAYRCKYYFAANSTAEKRCRALWLRCENQRPPIENAHAVLDALKEDGFTVCLLPSKEYVPNFGRAKELYHEAPVHMHQAFAPRSDAPRDAWAGKDGKGFGGKGVKGKDAGEKEPTGSGKDNWRESAGTWVPKSAVEGAEAPSKWKPVAEEGKGNSKGGKYGKDSEDKDHPGGKDSWRDPGASSSSAWDKSYGSWSRNDASWGKEGNGKGCGSRGPKQSKDSDEKETAFGKEWRETGPPAQKKPTASFAWIKKSEAETEARPSRGPRVTTGLEGGERGLASVKESWGEGGGMPGAWDSSSSTWMKTAVESVRWKLEVCINQGILLRSLHPRTVSEYEWLSLATLGSRAVAQACTQRASVLVGSFVEEGFYHLSATCAGEFGLAIVFRALKMETFFRPETVVDEQNDSQCASLLAAVFGELVDAPPMGESTQKENARKVAEWAILDFTFLVGMSRLTLAGLSGIRPAGAIAGDSHPKYRYFDHTD